MKQQLLIVLAVLFIIICITCGYLININSEKQALIDYNSQYEAYLNKQVLGTEVATLINKAIDQTQKNNIQKAEKGYYINNTKNSIKIDLKMTTIDKTYPMEEIYNKEITNFVQNFNLIEFKCINIEYHEDTGKVSKLVFEELEN